MVAPGQPTSWRPAAAPPKAPPSMPPSRRVGAAGWRRQWRPQRVLGGFQQLERHGQPAALVTRVRRRTSTRWDTGLPVQPVLGHPS
jgi:hypothetical protein